MQAELSQDGVFGYAVYFNSSGAQWTQLNPNSVAAPSTTIDLPSPFSSGKVYLVIESKTGSSPDLFAGGSGPSNTGVIQQESDLSWGNAQTYDFRYDSLELTLSGASADVANLTEITGFGLPMELQVPYSNGTSATVGYNVSGSQIESDIANINKSNTYNYNYSSGRSAATFAPRSRRAPTLLPPRRYSAPRIGRDTSKASKAIRARTQSSCPENSTARWTATMSTTTEAITPIN